MENREIDVFINGEQVVDYSQPENPERAGSFAGRVLNPEGGAIALQAHDPGSTFYFKSIRLRPLP